MKTTYVLAALSAICAVEAASAPSGMSTITCSACPPAPTSTADDMVTRSDEPVTPCTAPTLSVIPSNPSATDSSTAVGTGGMPTSTGLPVAPTDVPIAAGSRVAGSLGAAVALGAAAVYMM